METERHMVVGYKLKRVFGEIELVILTASGGQPRWDFSLDQVGHLLTKKGGGVFRKVLEDRIRLMDSETTRGEGMLQIAGKGWKTIYRLDADFYFSLRDDLERYKEAQLMAKPVRS
jgi:hypothetical protein